MAQLRGLGIKPGTPVAKELEIAFANLTPGTLCIRGPTQSTEGPKPTGGKAVYTAGWKVHRGGSLNEKRKWIPLAINSQNDFQ